MSVYYVYSIESACGVTDVYRISNNNESRADMRMGGESPPHTAGSCAKGIDDSAVVSYIDMASGDCRTCFHRTSCRYFPEQFSPQGRCHLVTRPRRVRVPNQLRDHDRRADGDQCGEQERGCCKRGGPRERNGPSRDDDQFAWLPVVCGRFTPYWLMAGLELHLGLAWRSLGKSERLGYLLVILIVLGPEGPV